MGRLFRATTRHNHKSSDMQSKMISNDQELTQSDPHPALKTSIEKVSRDRSIEKWLQTTPEDWNNKKI